MQIQAGDHQQVEVTAALFLYTWGSGSKLFPLPPVVPEICVTSLFVLNKLYTFWRWYINVTITILDIIHLLFKTQLNSIGLSVPRRKHITSPLRAKQVIGLWRWYVTITITILDIIHLLFKTQLHRFVCTSQEAHYVSATSPTGYRFVTIFYLKLNSIGLSVPRRKHITSPLQAQQVIGLWRWYVTITITILDITHRPFLHIKYNVSETGFCLRLQVGPTGRAISVSEPETGDTD
jgi:hypothetical protein